MHGRFVRKLTVLLLFTFILGTVPVGAQDYDPQHTMLALNMAIVSVHRIVTTQDRVVLDQEYKNIINNLSLGNIESDYDLTGLYQELMSLISQKRLREEETRMLQARYNRKEQNQIMDSLSSIRAYGGNLWSWLGSLAVSCVSSFFQYQDAKAELREGLDGELWQLRKEDITDCNELQERLLQSSWNLLRQYRLPDAYRLTQGSMGNFYKAAQEADPSKRLRMLRVLEDEFRVYPPYWFLRARAAQEAKNDKETRKCFDKFDEVWRPVLRRDPYKLEAAKFRIRELAASGKPVDEVRPVVLELLEVVRENTPKEDWANNLFAGVAYFTLGEKDAGVECVELNVDFEYEENVSGVILAQMKRGELDLSLLPVEVKNILMEQKEIESIKIAADTPSDKTKSTEKQGLTWEKISRIASKYGFEDYGNYMRREVNKHTLWFDENEFVCMKHSIWRTYGKRILYSELRNDPKFNDHYLRKLIQDLYKDDIPYGVIEDVVAALMEIKNLE